MTKNIQSKKSSRSKSVVVVARKRASVPKIKLLKKKTKQIPKNLPRQLKAFLSPQNMTLARKSLGKCVDKYACALSDPWSPMSKGVCIPKWPANPSQKNEAFVRFNITTGVAAGNTQLLFYTMPCLANDSPVIMYTNGAYTNRAFSSPGAPTPIAKLTTSPFPITFANIYGAYWLSFQYAPTPFATSQFFSTVTIPNVQGRVVSAGITYQNMSPTLNTGGIYYGYTEPSHVNLHSYSSPAISAQRATLIERGGIDKFSQVVYSVRQDEIEYNNSSDPYPLSSPTILDPTDPFYYNWSASAYSITFTSFNTIIAGGAPSFVTVANNLLPNTCVTFVSSGTTYYGVVATATQTLITLYTVDCSGSTYPALTSASSLISGGYGRNITAGMYYNNAGTQFFLSGAPMITIVTPGASSSIYEIEYIQHSEYIGPLTQGQQTINEMSTVGFEKVNAIAMDVSQDVSNTSNQRKFSQYGKHIVPALEFVAKAADAIQSVMGKRNRRGGRGAGISHLGLEN